LKIFSSNSDPQASNWHNNSVATSQLSEILAYHKVHTIINVTM
jgi:hypothetical protein